jgi:hypothetical protein
MDLRQFLAMDGPAIGLLVAGDEELVSLRHRLSDSGFVVREVRGRRMSTVPALLDEFAAALQFPYYFGENKDAFDECLRDLDEFLGPAGGYAVVVRDAPRLLSLEPRQWPWFVDAVGDAAQYWHDQPTPAALRVLLQTSGAAGDPPQWPADLPTLSFPA